MSDVQKTAVHSGAIINGFHSSSLERMLDSAIEGVKCFSEHLHVNGESGRSGYHVSATANSQHKRNQIKLIMMGYVEGLRKSGSFCEDIPKPKKTNGKPITARGGMDSRTKKKRKKVVKARRPKSRTKGAK